MTDGSRVTIVDSHAPHGRYRVICWRVRDGRAYESFVDGDFADKVSAKERANALAVPDVLWVAVYDSDGRVRHNCVFSNKADIARPMAVTRLAGFTDPEDRKKRAPYSRRS